MQTEIFKKYQPLTLFYCFPSVLETDGYMDFVNPRKGTRLRLNLKDTVVHPKGWDGTDLTIGYNNFDDDVTLNLSFGKPFCLAKYTDGKIFLKLKNDSVIVNDKSGEKIIKWDKLSSRGKLKFSFSKGKILINKTAVSITDDINGYMEMFCETGKLQMTEFISETKTAPFTVDEHKAEMKRMKTKQLDENDVWLDKLEKYIKENPDALPKMEGKVEIPYRLVDKGEKMVIKVISYGSKNASLTITHNSFNPDSEPIAIALNWETDGKDYWAEIPIEFNEAGNCRIEFWVNGQKILRSVGVLDKGYMAVIPWIGANRPMVDEELHRFDIAGDYWMSNPTFCKEPQETINKFSAFLKNYQKYGDRTVCFMNGRTAFRYCETDSLFELDEDSQRRAIAQFNRQMKILGYEEMELVASYTPDAVSIKAMEDNGVKGITSLCAWQNWQDGGWKINHCGVANQPYFPSDDDFRRSGEKRDIMCFTMGNSSCDRNYSIMAYDGCATNMVPGERYLNNFVVNQHMQRFYDVFDGYINDSKNNDELMCVTVSIEAFTGRMDWKAANEMALRYVAKKAKDEKIVFTSAAEISDYHKRKNLLMQEIYFVQHDCYYGYHNGTLPGRINDRIEADTREYLAVVRKGSMLPLYFYDYTKKWKNVQFEDTERNEFGLVDPDENKPSECYPKQVYREDMEIKSDLSGNILVINIKSETDKEKMVSAVFDIPFEKDFEFEIDKADAKGKKVTDNWTQNTHLFLDLGEIKSGESKIIIKINGKERKICNAELIKDNLAVMWFKDHAYMRCLDKEVAIRVRISAPKAAYMRLISGEIVKENNGGFDVIINGDWDNEAPLLYGYDMAEFEKNLKDATVEIIGKSKCSRWSGQ